VCSFSIFCTASLQTILILSSHPHLLFTDVIRLLQLSFLHLPPPCILRVKKIMSSSFINSPLHMGIQHPVREPYGARRVCGRQPHLYIMYIPQIYTIIPSTRYTTYCYFSTCGPRTKPTNTMGVATYHTKVVGTSPNTSTTLPTIYHQLLADTDHNELSSVPQHRTHLK